MDFHHIPFRQKSEGYSMLEVLVSLTIIAFAMLGAASMQLNSIKMSKSSTTRMQAVLLSMEIAERMESNKSAAVAGSYVVATTSTPSSADTNCLSVGCTAAQLASYDIAQWGTRVAGALPSASWQISQTIAGNPSTYTIVVNWQGRRDKTTYATDGSTENFAYTATRVIHN